MKRLTTALLASATLMVGVPMMTLPAGAASSGPTRGRMSVHYPVPMPTPPNASIHLSTPASTGTLAGGASGKPDAYTPFSHRFLRPDGRMELTSYPDPHFYRASDGSWHGIDLHLIQDSSGVWTETANDGSAPRFGASADESAIRLGIPQGTVVLSHPGAGHVAGNPGSDRASLNYPSALPGGQDVIERPTAVGAEDIVVVRDAHAPSSYRMDLSLPAGVTAQQQAHGVALVDAKGNTVLSIPDGTAEDSSKLPGPPPEGLGAETLANVRLAGTSGPVAHLSVSVDPAWLSDPARVFPVYLDPEMKITINEANGSGTLDTYVNSDSGTLMHDGETQLRVGGPGVFPECCADPVFPNLFQQNAGNNSRTRAFALFTFDNLTGAPYEGHTHVDTDLVNFYMFSAGGSTSKEYDLYGLNSAPNAQTAWNQQQWPDTTPPNSFSSITSYGASTYASVSGAVGYYSWDIHGTAINNEVVGSTDLADRWLNQSEPNDGVSLRSNASGSSTRTTSTNEYDNTGASLRRFYSAEFGTNQPYNDLIYETVPDPITPSATGAAGSANVTWTVPANNGQPITSYTIIAHDITAGTYTNQTCTTCNTTYLQTGSFTATNLTAGHTYSFQVYATNLQGSGEWYVNGIAQSNASNQVVIGSALTTSKGFGTLNASTGAVSCAAPTTAIYTVGRGAQVPYCVTLSNTSPAPITVTLSETLPAGLAAGGTPVTDTLGTCSPATCYFQGARLTVPSVSVAANGSETFAFAPVAVGSDAGCATVQNSASATATNQSGTSAGSATSNTISALVCDTGLGLENWWSYIDQSLGPQAMAHVNAADGNLVAQYTDSTAIQAHGHLDYVLRRTYNSQDTDLVNFPGSFGAGWMLNVSEADGLAGGGVGATGLYVPSAQAVASPMSVTLIDRDGTRHLFTPKSISAGPLDITTAPAASLLALVPKVLSLDTTNYNHLCVDQTYTAPAGVHLSLWRYIEVSSSSSTPCTSFTSSAVLGFAAERPDRVRYEFSSDGHLIDLVDSNGVELRYQYAVNPPVAGVALGQLQSIYETRAVNSTGTTFACSPSTPSCRAFKLNWLSSSPEVDITDPAGRITRYLFTPPAGTPNTQGLPTSGYFVTYQLAQVTNPDGSNVSYAYGSTNCSGAGANQLCSATDPVGNRTTFTYSGASFGPARVATITDRRANANDNNGAVTSLTYGSGYTDADTGAKTVSCSGNPACERRQFASIDATGRVGEIDEGNSANTFLHQAFYTWDSPGASCRQPDATVDNNLCHLVRRALNDTETATHNGVLTSDADTTYTYNAEGQRLVERRLTGSATLYQTFGYHAQYFETGGTFTTCGASLSVACYDDTVAGGGAVTSAGPSSGRADANTLYYVSDPTQVLSARGNAAGSGYAAYLTTYEVDDNPAVAPSTLPSGTVCGTAGTSSANTGDRCETDTPAASGVADPPSGRCAPAASHAEPYACVRYVYDTFGQKTSMTTAKANAETPAGQTVPAYSYTYYADSSSCATDAADCDLSGNVTAGGWLKAVTDPVGNFVAYAYDRAGNQVRTWDRNATAGTALSSYPGTVAAPPSSTYTETLYASGASVYSAPWRYVASKRDQMGDLTTYTLNANGDQTKIRPPRGNAAGNANHDVTQTFDANDNLLTHALPLGATGSTSPGTTTYTYDPFGNKASTQDANGKVRAYRHDSVNRLTETDWTRGTWPSGTPTTPPYNNPAVPSACKYSTSADAPIPTGMIECSTITSYDGVDNAYATQDGNHQTTYFAYDGVGRKTGQWVPRNDGALTTLYTEYAYDADGDQTDVCPPRQFAEGGFTAASLPTATTQVAATACAPPAQPSANAYYGTHTAYDAGDRKASATSYRQSVTPSCSVSGTAACPLGTSYGYDADANRVSSTDPRGTQTTYVFDLLDRKSSMTVPRDATHSFTTTWAYDPAGDVTSVIKPGSLDTGTGADGVLVVDGTTAANSSDHLAHPQSNPYRISGTPNYTNLTLQNGGWIAWGGTVSGNTGADMVFSATGTLSVCSSCGITVSGLGAVGGGPATSLTGSSAAGSGRGGGGAGGNGATGGGAGGGGHAGSGSPGQGATGGSGGSTYGVADLSDATGAIAVGSGGGGGGAGTAGGGGSGGNGGGFLHITAETMSIQGQISADGLAGANAAATGVGGGGGGGGGSGGDIWLSADSITGSSSTQLSVQGGPGGTGGTSVCTPGQNCFPDSGGVGADGFVRIDADSLSGVPAGITYLRRYTGRVTAYSYDPDHRLVDTVTGADNTDASQAGLPDAAGGINIRTRQVYDADGNVVARFAPGAFASSVTNPSPDYMSRADYDVDGRATASYVPRFDNASSSHTDLGSSLDPNHTQSAQCSTTNRPGSVTLPAGVAALPAYGSSEGVCVTSISYDAAGNRHQLTLPTSPGSGSTNRTVTYSYTDDNLVSSVSSPSPQTNGSQVTSQSTLYDADNKPVQQTDALGDVNTTSYYSDETVNQTAGQSYTPSGSNTQITHVTTYMYDGNGSTVKVTDPAGHATTTTYFSDGTRSSVTDGAGDITSYTYDANGNPTQVTSPSANAKDATNPSGIPTVNTYSLDNLLASTTVPVAHDSTASQRRLTTYTYDRGGRKVGEDVEMVDPNGNLLTNCGYPAASCDAGAQAFGYFDDDRMASQSGHAGSASITYQYDPNGNKTSVSDSTSALTVSSTFYLDDLPRSVNDGAARTSEYAYDGAGSRAVRADVNTAGTSSPTVYVFGDAELPTAVSWTDPGAPTGQTQLSYDAAGRPSSESYPGGAATTTFSFNPDDTLRLQDTTSNARLASWTYTYNNDYQQLSQTPFSGTAFSYSYDSANRLASFTDGTGLHSITYDRDSNRITYGPSGTFTYNSDDSMATTSGSATFVYSAAGDLNKDNVRVYCFDPFDRLQQTSTTSGCGDVGTSTSYTYDGLDRQRSHSDPGSTGPISLHYDGFSQTLSVEIQHLAPGSDLNTDYQLDPSGTPEEVNAQQAVGNPKTQFLLTDGQGNIVTGISTAASSAAACSVRLDPYGNVQGGTSQTNPCAPVGSSPDTQWYRAAHQDPQTGTYEFGSRTYDPAKGTFITPDSYRTGQPESDLSVHVDPLTENTYSYVNGDPVNLADPTGHVSRKFCEANDLSAEECDEVTAAGVGATPGQVRAAQGRILTRLFLQLEKAAAIDEYVHGYTAVLLGKFLERHKWQIIGGTAVVGVAGSGLAGCLIFPATTGVCAGIGIGATEVGGAGASELWAKEATDLASKEADVFTKMLPQVSNYAGTELPRAFIFEDSNVFVTQNATKHIAEYLDAISSGSELRDLATQFLLKSLQAAVGTAQQVGITYGKLMNIGGWELGFGPPRSPGELPALTHAVPFQ